MGRALPRESTIERAARRVLRHLDAGRVACAAGVECGGSADDPSTHARGCPVLAAYDAAVDIEWDAERDCDD